VGLKDSVVKSSVLPKTAGELERDIQIQGNVIVEGALYSRNLIIEQGPVTFQTAVYAHNELHIRSDALGVIYFTKAAASSDSIVALLTRGEVIFGSDINGKSVKLKNCFVAGSIFAEDIQLENCTVLGGCFASKALVLQNVIAGTFNAPEVSAGGINYLLYPTAFSVEPLASLPGTEFYNLTLADLGALFKGDAEMPNTGKIRIDMSADSQRTVLVDEEGTNILLNSYSVSSRVLVSDLIDFERLENHFLIAGASLGSQILKTYSLQKDDGNKSEDLTVQNIAAFFSKILNGIIQIQDISGTIPFDELKEKYK
jgi:hypothetical protein